MVIYGQYPAGCPTLKSLEDEVTNLPGRLALLVYDNSPTPAPFAQIPDKAVWDVTYWHDPTNPGVSAAYRAGCELAHTLGKRWLLLLDQDTRFTGNALSRYCEAMRTQPDATMLCPVLRAGSIIISPCAYRHMRGRQLQEVPVGVRSFAGVSVLNSGMCIAIETYLHAGGHDPAIPLDFSDHEFVSRLRRITSTFVVVNTVADHGFSGLTAQSKQSAALRFAAYSRGAFRAAKNVKDLAAATILVLVRAIMLSRRYRSPTFLCVAISSIAHRG